MATRELVVTPRPELLEELPGELGRGAGVRLWSAQVEHHLTDAADLRPIDAMERNDDVGARARGLEAVMIDRPVEDTLLVEDEIPIGGKSLS